MLEIETLIKPMSQAFGVVGFGSLARRFEAAQIPTLGRDGDRDHPAFGIPTPVDAPVAACFVRASTSRAGGACSFAATDRACVVEFEIPPDGGVGETGDLADLRATGGYDRDARAHAVAVASSRGVTPFALEAHAQPACVGAHQVLEEGGAAPL